MNIFKLTIAAAALAVSAGVASASTIFADSVVAVSPGVQPGDPSRYIATNALGAPDGDFYSVGLGGSITLGFPGTPLPGAALSTVYEITTNRNNDHDEAADVFAVLGVNETFIGTIFNAPSGSTSVFVTFAFDAIKIVDVTAREFGALSTSHDGYDIDAVAISAIPLPAAGFLLIAALGGLGIAGRRKKA